MRFDRSGRKDDVLFVVAIVLTALFTGARFFDSEREMNQIAQAQQQATMVAADHSQTTDVPIAYAKADAR